VNPETARRLVLLSLGTMFAVTTMRHQQGKLGGSTYRRLWATGVLAILLSMFADFVPEVAGPLALLIGLTYIMGAEETIAAWLQSGLGEPAAAGAAAGTLAAPKPQNPTQPGQRPRG
jgi:hypothetical protein